MQVSQLVALFNPQGAQLTERGVTLPAGMPYLHCTRFESE
jgi:hypothetical protein